MADEEDGGIEKLGSIVYVVEVEESRVHIILLESGDRVVSLSNVVMLCTKCVCSIMYRLHEGGPVIFGCFEKRISKLNGSCILAPYRLYFVGSSFFFVIFCCCDAFFFFARRKFCWQELAMGIGWSSKGDGWLSKAVYR